MLRSIFITIFILENVNLYEISEKVPDEIIYYKDHEVSYEEARDNIKLFRENSFQHCNPCTQEHRNYCESETFMNDHCCCNQGYTKDQLYFMPHICYASDKACTPSWGSCLTTMEIRSCCCDPYLYRKWKSILKSNASWKCSRIIYVLFSLLFAMIFSL